MELEVRRVSAGVSALPCLRRTVLAVAVEDAANALLLGVSDHEVYDVGMARTVGVALCAQAPGELMRPVQEDAA